jgi:hypothetical protein
MTTPSSKLPPSTDASPVNPVCQHGVSLSLDDDPHCFECSKVATAYGLPANARMMNYPNALVFTAMLENREAIDGTPAPAAVYSRPEGTTDTVGAQAPDAPDICPCPRCTLRRSIEAQGRLDAAPPVDFTVRTPTGLERLMNDLRTQQTNDVKLSGGQRMLERVVVQLRAELTEASQDRDDFAAENLDLLQRQGNDANRIEALEESEQIANATVVELQKRLNAQVQATEAQKANAQQAFKLYNDAIGGGSITDLIRERNGLLHELEELKAKQAEIMAVVTRFG